MFRRSNHECVIKVLLSVVLIILIVNIYFLSLIFRHEGSQNSSNTITIKSSDEAYSAVFSTTKVKFKTKPDAGKTTKKPAVFVHTNTTQLATKKILKTVALLQRHYKNRFFSSKLKQQYEILLNSIKSTDIVSADYLETALKWVNGRELFPEVPSQQLGQALNTLCSSRIVHADNTKKGTQLKIFLTFEGGHKGIFKPQWYKKDEVIVGEVFAGKDRHNGEVAAFYLSMLLGLRRAPLTVGRKVNLRREIIPVATPALLQTFYQEGNNTCFYGVCYYCHPQDPVCATQDVMEGALILWLPDHFPLKKYRHPWQRTYKPDVPTRWEVDADYCQMVRKSSLYSRGPRLLDVIDASIFDFLIDNGDRHHYEVFENISNSAVLLIDNGKSFGNPTVDHIDILAPLYQCCRLRASTWTHLLWLRGGMLGETLSQLLEHSHISPVLTASHLTALDRRVSLIIATVNVCFKERNGESNPPIIHMFKRTCQYPLQYQCLDPLTFI